MVCKTCGKILRDDALFCTECGAKQKNNDVSCPKCGSAISKGTLFCTACGTQLSEENLPVNENEVAEDEAIKERQYNQNVNAMRSAENEEDFNAAAAGFDELNNYKDAIVLKEQCLDRAEECRKDAIYVKASEQCRKGTLEDLKVAIQLFDQISGWRNSGKRVLECKTAIATIEKSKVEKERQRKKEEEAEKEKLLLRLRMMK